MRIEDMILVSIDDHVIEPRDMFERHVPEKYKDDAPEVVTNDEGVEQWLFQGATAGSMGLNAVVTLAQVRLGDGPDELRRDASRRVRRARAHPRHEPQRHPLLDVLPDVRRVQRRHVQSGRRQRPVAAHAPGLQRLAHRRVGSRVPRPVHPARDRSHLGSRTRMVAEIRRVSAKGCTAMTFPELPHIEGLPSYHNLELLGSGVRGAVRRAGRDVPAHRPGLRRHQHRAGRADRQHDHPRDAGVGVRGAGPAVGPGVPHLSRPQGCVVGSGNRLDPVLPRSLRPSLREPAVVGSRLRRQDAERHLPRPLARVLRRAIRSRSRCATTSASTSSPGSATTRTPTRSGPTRPRR